MCLGGGVVGGIYIKGSMGVCEPPPSAVGGGASDVGIGCVLCLTNEGILQK